VLGVLGVLGAPGVLGALGALGVLGALGALGVAGVAGCGGRTPVGGQSAARVDPADHVKSPAARRRALTLTHAEVRERVGGHVFRATHRLSSSLDGQTEQSWVDRYELRCRQSGDCYGRHHNSLEYGVEFFRLGEHTYFRHRYQSFLRFSEAPREAERRVERIWGVGAAVIRLVGRQLSLRRDGEVQVAGRTGVRYRLQRRKKPRADPPAGLGSDRGSRAWRARLQVTRLTGEAVLDRDTGVPLRLAADYRITAPKQGKTVAIAGKLEGALSEVGGAPEVSAPEDYTPAIARRREVLDEKALLRDERLNPGWFRGGGPHAARRRQRQGRTRHRRRRGRAAPRPAAGPGDAPRRRARPRPRARPAARARPRPRRRAARPAPRPARP
jgi:hypothetical protein